MSGMQTHLDCCNVQLSTGERENNGDNLLRFSIVVDGIKEFRTHMGSTGSSLLF